MARTDSPPATSALGINAILTDPQERAEHFAELGRKSAQARRGGLVLTNEEVEAVRATLAELAGDPRWQRIWRRLLAAPQSGSDAGDAT